MTLEEDMNPPEKIPLSHVSFFIGMAILAMIFIIGVVSMKGYADYTIEANRDCGVTMVKFDIGEPNVTVIATPWTTFNSTVFGVTDANGSVILKMCKSWRYNITTPNRSVVLFPRDNEYVIRGG
jgi:C4-dicarboxylate-specific signal transduction histidine kinase